MSIFALTSYGRILQSRQRRNELEGSFWAHMGTLGAPMWGPSRNLLRPILPDFQLNITPKSPNFQSQKMHVFHHTFKLCAFPIHIKTNKRYPFSNSRHHNTWTMNFLSKSATQPKKIISFESFSMSIDQGKQSSIFQGGSNFHFVIFFGYFRPLVLILVEKKIYSIYPVVLVDFWKFSFLKLQPIFWIFSKKQQKIRRNSRTVYPSSILRPFLESTENFQPNRVE
jgi:hypothetical protein